MKKIYVVFLIFILLVLWLYYPVLIKHCDFTPEWEVLIKNNNLVELKKILKHNPKIINVQNKYGQTPLIVSLFAAKYDIAKFLLDHDCDIFITDNGNRFPLHWACIHPTVPVFCKIKVSTIAKKIPRLRMGKNSLLKQ
jgi:hypothetical protein